MRHIILYRKCNFLKEDELEIAAAEAAGFVLISSRTQVQPDDLVVARYSAIPFYNELELDLHNLGAKLINTYQQHQYIADLINYVADLKELTPETWDRLEDLPEEGPFVLKGGTNSRKGQWKTHMWAPDKKTAIQVYYKLLDDSLIGQQPIYIRKFVPLYTYYQDVVGMPVTKEFRFFVCDQQILSGGFYWSSHVNELATIPSINEVPASFLKEVIARIARNSHAPRFYVLDVGLKENGEPIVIELNDGQQSGISENSPSILYRNLKRQLEKTS